MGAVAAELVVQELQQYISEASLDALIEKVIQAAFHKTNETEYQRAHAWGPRNRRDGVNCGTGVDLGTRG